jgi:hypothetical protein
MIVLVPVSVPAQQHRPLQTGHPSSKAVAPCSITIFSVHRWQKMCGHASQATFFLRMLPHLWHEALCRSLPASS